MEKIEAPFTEEQVEGLNFYQESGIFHPFTCGTNSNHRVLVATTEGWICKDCTYRQNWAHKEMADKEFIQRIKDQMPWLK